MEENINGATIKIEGNKAIIELELDPNGQISSSGKSRLLYTSHGWAKMMNGMKINLGIIRPLK
jgi:hypothetical protein